MAVRARNLGVNEASCDRAARRAYIALGRARYPLVMLALAASPASADPGKLTVTAQARIRGEAIADSFRADAPRDEQAILYRTNLFAEYDAGRWAIAGEIQDSRAWTETLDGETDQDAVNALEPIQAYLRLRPSDAVAVQLGRFTIDLGSRRLVARPNFRNTSTAFTGARIDLGRDRARHHLTAFWVLPQTRLPDGADAIAANRAELDRERIGLQFFGAVATRHGVAGGKLETSAFRLFERDSPGIATRDRRLWALSLRHSRDAKAGRWDHDVEAAIEGGSARASSAAADRDDRPVSAGFARAALGYSFASAGIPRVQFALDYASGDRPGRTIGRFDTLFGDGSFEFGPSSLYSLVARANLVSAEARLEVAAGKRSDGYLAVRPLWLASATDAFGNSGVRDATGRSGRFAGTQIEGRVRHWLVGDRLRLSGGGAWLAKGGFLRNAPNAPATGDAIYGYLELTLER